MQAVCVRRGVVLLCGRYEGVDQRVIEARGVEEVSAGDFVLSGGELPAMMVLDASVRLLPGVMGAAESAIEESFAGGLLEYPHYTRPARGKGGRCRLCCCRAIMRLLRRGGATRPKSSHASAGPICGLPAATFEGEGKMNIIQSYEADEMHA